MFSPTKSTMALEAEKQETVRKMTRCWAEPEILVRISTDDATYQPPGAPPIAVDEFVATIGAFASVPEWAMKTEVLGFNDDGTAEVTTQQLSGAMKADLAAFGPWPEVKLADAPAAIRDGFEAVYPKETATIEFTYDGKKIKKAVWHSVEATEGANTTHVDPPSGFICLRLARRRSPVQPAHHGHAHLAKWAKKLGIKM
ncbi:hypothetical protein JL720_7479 [Aureococcus anophagefferens]|nr:hypothetical protein JL720_7479 [Aureococcus anophagefferens]